MTGRLVVEEIQSKDEADRSGGGFLVPPARKRGLSVRGTSDCVLVLAGLPDRECDEQSNFGAEGAQGGDHHW